MSAPTIDLLEDASNATFWGPITTAYNLAEMNGADGAPLQVATPNGCTAAAFSDYNGNIIIAFQGTQSAQQQLADVELMSGQTAAAIPAFQDAVAFVKSVEKQAAAMGVPKSHIYISGHSLGGTLAEYAASQTGLAGASFAGSGIPGYHAPAAPASNFISYVEHGDAFANWSTDGTESAVISAGGHQDHYGQLVMLGSPSQDVLTNNIVSDYKALVPALFEGRFFQAAAKLGADFTNNLLTIHGMDVYGNSIAALPAPNFASLVAKVAAEPSMLSNFGAAAPVAHAPATVIPAAASLMDHLAQSISSSHQKINFIHT